MSGRYDDNALMHRHVLEWVQTPKAGASATTLVIGLLFEPGLVVQPAAPADDGDALRCAAACTEFRLWGRLAEMPKLFPCWTAEHVKAVRHARYAMKTLRTDYYGTVSVEDLVDSGGER